ncbi:BofC C-terminal domain-containing protein [Treponema sp. R6D11]
MTKTGILAFICGIIYTFVLGFAMFYLGTRFPATKSTLAAESTPVPVVSYNMEEPTESPDGALPPDEIKYMIQEYNGAIGVFKGTELIKIADVDIESLRAGDREALVKGIIVDTEEEVARLLEDYGS